MFLDEYASFILENRKNGMSCGDIAAALGSQFGNIRGLMTGYLSANGVKASEGRVGKVLRRVHQPYHIARHQVRS